MGSSCVVILSSAVLHRVHLLHELLELLHVSHALLQCCELVDGGLPVLLHVGDALLLLLVDVVVGFLRLA